MKHLFLLLSFFLALFLTNPGYPQEKPYKEGEILVKYKSGVASEIKSAIRNRRQAQLIRTFQRINVHHMRLPQGTDVLKAVEDFKSDPNVEFAEPNYIRRPFLITPNDQAWPGQWGMVKVGMADAWTIGQGSSAVKVAVVDTGVDYTHPELAPNIWINPGEISGNSIDDDGNGYIDDIRGWNFLEGNNNPMDTEGHGTHLAGIIGAIGNNSAGVAGINWNINLMPLRFMTYNAGSVDGECDAIDYAASRGARVVNASFGGFSSDTERDCISSHPGLLIVAAAGNYGTNMDSGTKIYPAAYGFDNIIAVAATDSYDHLASFSNYGHQSVHIAAPGVNITSTVASGSSSLAVEGVMILKDSSGTQYRAKTVKRAAQFNAGAITGSLYSCTNNDCQGANSKIALIRRTAQADYYTDEVNVTAQVNSAMAAGAIAVIVYDFATEDNSLYLTSPFPAYLQGQPTQGGSWIPAITVTYTDGQYLKSWAGSTISLAYPYYIMSGTSMAAPFVTGAAALVLAEKPDLSVAQLKEVLTQSVDVIPSLTGKVSSNGRLNVARALETVRRPPYQLTLGAGWNLVSFPKLPNNPAGVEQVFPSTNQAIPKIIWGYDGSTRQWKKWRPNDPANSISLLEFGKGYWIYMGQEGSINLSGWSTPSSYSVSLCEGWNLAAYQGPDRAPLDTQLSTINNKWSMIWGWDEGEWSAQAASITLPPTIPPLSSFYQGKAYWIQIKQGMTNVQWNQ